MKIFFFIHSLKIGGTEKQVLLLSEALSNLGYKILIGYIEDGPLLRNFKTQDITFYKLNIKKRKSPLALLKIYSLISREKPDLVQTFLSYMDLTAGFISLFLKIPLILSERSNGLNEVDNKVVIFFKYLILRFSKGYIICNSIPGKNFWLSKLSNSKVKYFPNIIKSKNINKKIESKKSLNILFACRFTKSKNTLLAAKVFCALQKNLPECNFYFIGDGELKNECVKYIEENSILPNNFFFTGFTENITYYFLKSTVFLSLSSFEGTPNTVLEAAINKCPLVLSEIPSHMSIFSVKESFFVPLNNVEEIVDTLYKVLKSPKLCEKKALLAYKLVKKNYDAKKISYSYDSFYQSLVK